MARYEYSQSLAEKIEGEISKLADIVKSHENDANGRGVPLKLKGARYRIYDTAIPDSARTKSKP